MTVHIANGKVKVLGTGHAFPNLAINNDELLANLAQMTNAKSARIAARLLKSLGIDSRHLSRRLDRAISAPLPDAISLSSSALQMALKSCKHHPKIDYLISHTATPHTQLPSNAAWIADRLQLAAPYLELRQACTGFASALQIAVPMLTSNTNTQAVSVVGCEVGSVYFDLSSTFVDTAQLINYVQMGDGAAGVVLGPDDGSNRAIISDCYSGHIGLGSEPGFMMKHGGSGEVLSDRRIAYFDHHAAQVRDLGPALFLKGIEAVVSRGHQLEDFKFIIPHQANGKIDQLLGEALDVPANRIINDAKAFGNLGSAAIWASFSRLIHSGRLEPGDKVLVLGAESTKYMYGGFVYQH